MKQLNWVTKLSLAERVFFMTYLKALASDTNVSMDDMQKSRIREIHIDIIEGDGAVPEGSNFKSLLKRLQSDEKAIEAEVNKLHNNFCEDLTLASISVTTHGQILSTTQAAEFTGQSKRRIRHLAQSKKIEHATKTERGHWRFIQPTLYALKTR